MAFSVSSLFLSSGNKENSTLNFIFSNTPVDLLSNRFFSSSSVKNGIYVQTLQSEYLELLSEVVS